MQVPRCKLLSKLCCGFRIQLRVSGWPLFDRTMGCSRFTCLQGSYVLFFIQSFVLPHNLFTAQSFLEYDLQEGEGILLMMRLDVESSKPPF